MPDEIKFEKAMEKLEEIVASLESGEISLDEALKKYEEGVKLSRLCQSKLEAAEKKIEILTKQMDGSLVKENFDTDDSELAKENLTKRKPKNSAKSSDQDKDIIL